jgi:hypothetical protein
MQDKKYHNKLNTNGLNIVKMTITNEGYVETPIMII